jgi:hypothetical protein
MFVLLVCHGGKEVYRRLFHRRLDAESWYFWRVRKMHEGTARQPGDQVTLSTVDGVVLAAEGARRNVRTG